MSRALRIFTAGALTALAVLLPGVASAHTSLISSDPADGAELAAPPTSVTLVFVEPLLPDFVRVIGIAPDGASGDLPIESIDGATVVVAWPASAPGGTWSVEYRVVSQDGHPINGSVTFSYPSGSATPTPSPSTATPTPTSASAEPQPTTAEPTTAEPTSASPTSAEPTPSPSPAAATSDTNTGWIIAGVAVVVLAVIAVVGLIIRRRNP